MESEKVYDEMTGEFRNKDDILVEGMISLWNINKKGYLMKKKQVSFNHDFEFQQSNQDSVDKIRLKLSTDKKMVSLAVTGSEDRKHPSFGKLQILGWNSSNLKAVTFHESLTKNVTKAYSQNLTTMMDYNQHKPLETVKPYFDFRIVGESKYLMMHCNSAVKDKVFQSWYFYNLSTGVQVFHINNRFISPIQNT